MAPLWFLLSSVFIGLLSITITILFLKTIYAVAWDLETILISPNWAGKWKVKHSMKVMWFKGQALHLLEESKLLLFKFGRSL